MYSSCSFSIFYYNREKGENVKEKGWRKTIAMTDIPPLVSPDPKYLPFPDDSSRVRRRSSSLDTTFNGNKHFSKK